MDQNGTWNRTFRNLEEETRESEAYKPALWNYCFRLKDKSGVDKTIVKKQPYQLLTPIVSSFQVLMPPTFINWLMNLRKLGQISSPFCILYECLKAR